MAKDEIRSSRVGRAARISGAAAGVAGREATARALARTSSSQKRADAAGRQHLKAAEQLVKTFSKMRGAAMKIGQTISAVDVGLVPEEYRAEFQAILAQLQDSAEPVSFQAVEGVLEADLGTKVADAFAEFDPKPIAAASIGQVHRAELKDGRPVAVKVQYPGIAEAVRADLQNLRMVLKLVSTIAPGVDTAAVADEIRDRIGDELDYDREAANQHEMALVYRDHPFVVVPDVVPSHSRTRVLTTEYIEGRRFAEVIDAAAAERDRFGEMLVRFYLNGPLRHRLLNGDPHPGNTLFLADGRIACLDFGFFKHLGDKEVKDLVDSTSATAEGDAETLMKVVSDVSGLAPDPSLAEPFLENYQGIYSWLFVGHPHTIEASSTAEMIERYGAMRKDFEGLTMPAEHFVLTRAVFLLIGLLGQLRATGAWMDVTKEWLYRAEPVTELGLAEEEFFGARYPYTTEVTAAVS